MASDPNANIKVDQVEAKQGSTQPKLIYVLGAGLVLVIVAFLIIRAMT